MNIARHAVELGDLVCKEGMAAVARGGKVVQDSAAAALGGGRRNRGAGDVAPGSILTFAPPSMRI